MTLKFKKKLCNLYSIFHYTQTAAKQHDNLQLMVLFIFPFLKIKAFSFVHFSIKLNDEFFVHSLN